MKKLLLTTFSLCLAMLSLAQMTVTEKDYDISRKARKGYLAQIVKDEAKGTFDLIYILKSTNKKVFTETYTYDKDLNLVNTVKEEEEIEKLRKKYKWFRYRGETYETQSLYVRKNMMMQMVFRQKTTQYKWSWWRGGYGRKVILGAKVKPTDEERNAKYSFLGGYYENDPAGLLLVLGGQNGTKEDPMALKSYKILQADKDANITITDELKFDLPQSPVFSKPLEDDDPSPASDNPRDWIVVFNTAPAAKKKNNKEIDVFTYCRISPEGKLIERCSFTTPTVGWRMIGAYEKNGEVYFYGPAIHKEGKTMTDLLGMTLATTSNEDADEDTKEQTKGGIMGNIALVKGMATGEIAQFTQDGIDDMLEQKKYTNFEVAKISGGKMKFITSPDVEEINDKNVKPDGQKKKVKFDGKMFLTTDVSITDDNNLFVAGQDYSRGTYHANNKIIGSGAKRLGPLEFQNMFLLQYDADGKFLRNYGVEVDQKKRASFWSGGPAPNLYPANSTIIESADHKQLHWIMKICRAFDSETDIDDSYNFYNGSSTRTVSTSYTPLYTIQYGSINKGEGSASDFKTLGEDEKRKYFLMNGYNSLRLDNYLIYLSETKKGDKLLLSRFDVAK